MHSISIKLSKFLRSQDYLLLSLCLLSSAYGILLIYSATYSYETLQYVYTQLAAVFLGVLGYLVVSCLDLRRVAAQYLPLYLCNLLLLGSLHFFGVGDGNRSWIRFGGIGIQPAEIGKLLFILSFAGHLSAAHRSGMRLRDLAALLLHALSLCAFVMVFSKDDGMTLAFLSIFLCMSYAAGARLRWFFCGAVLLFGMLPLLWNFLLNTYQRQRILAVFQPEAYPDTAYQALQTASAIRAGGFTGQGYLQGSKTQSGLIPTKHTDSILAAAGEELGFFGCAAILLLLFLITVRCLSAAFHSKDAASSYIAAGVAGMLLFQTVLNIGMNLGFLPIVGLTLPFFSYGGSSTVTMYLAMGVVSALRRSYSSDSS